ncbi:MAG: M48 family metalloprotease [Alphaproteobacteria bacterium]
MHRHRTVRIDTPGDVASLVAHGGMQAAIMTAVAVYAASPIETTAALLVSVLSYYFSPFGDKEPESSASPSATDKEKKTGSDHLAETQRELSGFRHLYSTALGVKKKPALIIEDNDINGPAEADIDMEQKPSVIRITTSLLNVLNVKEKGVVVAHEVAHLAAKHEYKRAALVMLGSTATANAAIDLYANLFNSKGIVALGVGAVGFYLVAGAANNNFITMQDARRFVKHIKHVALPSSMALATGTGLMMKVPGSGKALAVSALVYSATKLFDASFSRSAERQADRIAGEVSKEPWSLSSALLKMRQHNDQISRERGGKKRSGILHAFKRAKEIIFATHPGEDRRSRHLGKIAARLDVPGPD